MNLQIPDQLVSSGLVDLELGELLNPELTTVHIPIQKMATEAVNLLIKKINNPKMDRKTQVIKTNLVVRNSCTRNHQLLKN